MKLQRSVLSTVCLFLLAVTIAAQNQASNVATTSQVSVPHLVKFSGTVRDDEGHPRSGVVGLTFGLYKDQQGGAPLWLETQNAQADAKGNYSVLLGSTKTEGLPTNIFSSNEARWLGVQVEGREEQPRTLLVSAPYALKAGDAETLGGKPLSAFQLVGPRSSAESSQAAMPLADQPNEITCASGTACQTDFLPLFTKNGGSAKVSDSIISQIGGTVDVGGPVSVSGGVTGQTGFFRSNNNGAIFQATQTSNGAGVALAGVAEGTTGIGVEGSGVTGVSGFGLSDGTGLAGQGGTGVFGFSSPTSGFARATVGVLNTTASGSAAVYGIAQNSSGQTFGVQGYNFANTDFASGVSGVADGDQNRTFGVTGISLSPNGTGLWGLGQGQSVTGGGVGCCVVGVWGDTSSNAGGAAGLVGTADDARAIFLQNNSPSGVPTAHIFQAASNQLALEAGGFGGLCTIDSNGHQFCPHFAVMAPVDNGQRQVALYAMESPQNWFEDFGSGQLAGGTAAVALDPTFAETVTGASDYHVFLAPEGDCKGLYVSRKSAAGFEVRELGGGRSNIAFSYRIVALRRGFENVRLEDMTERWKKSNASMPKPSGTPSQRWTPPARPKPFAAPVQAVSVAPAKSIAAVRSNP
jgi:hypothetical protein